MPHTVVIFGASGDLTRRKLIPALYNLHRKGRLPAGTRVVGFSRTPFADEAFRARLAESTAARPDTDFEQGAWDEFARGLFYHPGDIGRVDDFASLGKRLAALGGGPRIYYLSTAPQFYETAVAHLGAAGLVCRDPDGCRLVVEKPFGRDLASARHLNAALHRIFDERQVYRIDHYLGKETVQNLLVFRFANTIFEPVWNRNYIDHVQITAAEELTVGHRAGYYESAGVLRDMVQNHLVQLLTLTAMEAPIRYEADAVRDEKAKVLRAVRPLGGDDVAEATLRGQYRKYRDEPKVAAESRTATFAAVRLWIDSWRWQGVPFYLRSGKAMSCATTQIVIQFRAPPLAMFRGGRQANRLVIQIQPAEGIQLHFLTKVPDEGMALRMSELDFRFRKVAAALPEAYQRLLLDVLVGDPGLFARSDEVELAWGIVDPIQRAWDEWNRPELALYEEHGWGPPESSAWMDRQGRAWFDACPVLE